jgi:hypothetical protein
VTQRAYKITDAAGVLQFRAVVQDGAGACKKPAAANAAKCVGVTQEAQATQNRNVLVRESGRTFVTAAGKIDAGDAVAIGDNTGKVVSCETDYAAAAGVAKLIYCIGFARTDAAADGDICEIEIRPHLVKTAAS